MDNENENSTHKVTKDDGEYEIKEVKPEVADANENKKSFSDNLKEFGARAKKWFIGLAILLVVAAIASAFLPRVWARSIADLIDGKLITGSALGVGIGFFSMLLALVFIVWGLINYKNTSKAIFLLIIGVICAFPNLMTLWVSIGVNSAASAGRQILNVDGPGFRVGTLIGAVVGAGMYLYILQLKRSKNKLKEAKSENSKKKKEQDQSKDKEDSSS